MPSRIVNMIGSTRAASTISEPSDARTKWRKSFIEVLEIHPLASYAIQNHGDCQGHSERDLESFGIVERNLASRQVELEQSGNHVRDVAQGLAQAAFVDDENHSHNPGDQHGAEQHAKQVVRAKKCAQGSRQLPVSA